MKNYRITNINTQGHHFLIHVFYKDLSFKEVHAYNEEQLNEKINKIMKDKKFYDLYIFLGIDFDLEESK